MKTRLKARIYHILKKQGITNRLQNGGTFRNNTDFGYWFVLSDNRRGRIFTSDSSKIVWD